MRRRDFTDSVANGAVRGDSPRFPDCREGELERELNGTGQLGLTHASGILVGHELGGRRITKFTTHDLVASFHRGSECGFTPKRAPPAPSHEPF